MAVSHCLQSQFPEMEPPSYSDFPSVRQLCLAPDLCKFLAHLFHSFLEGMGASGFDNFHRCEMIHWDQPVSSRWLVWPRMDTGYRLHTTSHILQHQSAEQNNHEMTDLQWAALYPSVIPQTISPPRLSGYHPQHSHAQLHRREHHLRSSWSKTCPCDRRTLKRMYKDNYKDSIRLDHIRSDSTGCSIQFLWIESSE